MYVARQFLISLFCCRQSNTILQPDASAQSANALTSGWHFLEAKSYNSSLQFCGKKFMHSCRSRIGTSNYGILSIIIMPHYGRIKWIIDVEGSMDKPQIHTAFDSRDRRDGKGASKANGFAMRDLSRVAVIVSALWFKECKWKSVVEYFCEDD